MMPDAVAKLQILADSCAAYSEVFEAFVKKKSLWPAALSKPSGRITATFV
jgi:hypothetical protein